MQWRRQKNPGHNFLNSMVWKDKNSAQQIDSDDRPSEMPPDQTRPENQQHENAGTETKSFLPPMKCCCTKCCCNCGITFGDEQPGNDGQNRMAAHTSRRLMMNRNSNASGSKNSGSNNAGGVELAPLLARRRAKQHALSTTDVTKLPNPSK